MEFSGMYSERVIGISWRVGFEELYHQNQKQTYGEEVRDDAAKGWRRR